VNECSRILAGARFALTALALSLALTPADAGALPGPTLTEPADALGASVVCSGDPGASAAAPVLLVHGTFGDAGYWSGNLADALPRDRHPVCSLTTPGRQFIDAQRSTEYVVNAIRVVFGRAGRRIAVVTHSQSGLLATLALRFWPDLADRVSDFVGLAGIYENGDAAAAALCQAACPPAGWQISPGSSLLEAFARKPPYRGPAYTSIATADDLLVTPQPSASHLSAGRNITLQDICPERVVEHMTIAFDALAYALVRDAIEHDGPADPARVSRAMCRRWLLPGADPTRFVEEVARAAPFFPQYPNGARDGEPPLRCYLDPACPKRRLLPRVVGSITRARSGHVTLHGRVVLPSGALDQCAGSVRVLAGRSGIRRQRSTVPVSYSCRFAARLPARVLRERTAALLRYGGSPELLPARVRLARSAQTRHMR
jgi:triacylglycerol lipase